MKLIKLDDDHREIMSVAYIDPENMVLDAEGFISGFWFGDGRRGFIDSAFSIYIHLQIDVLDGVR